jgi:hypothetical protein
MIDLSVGNYRRSIFFLVHLTLLVWECFNIYSSSLLMLWRCHIYRLETRVIHSLAYYNIYEVSRSIISKRVFASVQSC